MARLPRAHRIAWTAVRALALALSIGAGSLLVYALALLWLALN